MKNKVLDVLAYSVPFRSYENETGHSSPVLDNVYSALVSFSDQHFPLDSSEFTEGTAQRQHYLAAMDKCCQLLASVDRSQTQILKFLVEICCREKLHPSLDKVTGAFSAIFDQVRKYFECLALRNSQ